MCKSKRRKIDTNADSLSLQIADILSDNPNYTAEQVAINIEKPKGSNRISDNSWAIKISNIMKKRQRKTINRTDGKSSKASNNHLNKSMTSVYTSTPSTSYQNPPFIPVSFADLGGIDNVLSDVNDLIIKPLMHPECYKHLNIEPPHGILIHGPPGTGKTALAHAIVTELQINYFELSGPEVVSGMSGESESKIRDLFSSAITNEPSIIFIDEFDAIAPKRERAQREMEKRIVAQLLTCLGQLAGTRVIVIAATNRPDSIDLALRRSGRFDREITIGIPSEAARASILKVLFGSINFGDGSCNTNDLAQNLARRTPGFVGADLAMLTREASLSAVKRFFDSTQNDDSNEFSSNQLQSLCIKEEDFDSALLITQPSSKREGFTTIPDVTWDAIGGLEKVHQILNDAVVGPMTKPEIYAKWGLKMADGVLFYGPPGCGKTLVAKALANECRTSFISIKGPQLLNKYVGESELAVRLLFSRARDSAPCIIFFDELDALAPSRSGSSSDGHHSERVVNQLLTEMDGLDGRQNVFVIGATNRPEMIDKALLRPGRLNKMILIPIPSKEDRVNILRSICKVNSTPTHFDIDLNEISGECEGFSGADLANLIREASLLAMKESSDNITIEKITTKHFIDAAKCMKPSVATKDNDWYIRFSEKT